MADATAALSGSGSDPFAALAGGATSSSGVIAGYNSSRAAAHKLFGEEENLQTDESSLISSEMAAQDKARDAAKLEYAQAAAKQPVPEKPTAAPTEKDTPPMKQWGSAAMMFAMLGSLLTRTPMNSALNAAAGAMNAFKQNDIDTYNREFQKWQTESNNAAKMFEYEDRAYQKVMAEVDRRDKETDAEYTSRIRDIETHVRALAASFRDEKTLMLLGNQGLTGVEKTLQDQRTWMTQMQRAQAQIQKDAPDNWAFQAFQTSPEGQKLYAEAKAGVPGAAGRLANAIKAAVPSQSEKVDTHIDSAIDRDVKALQGSQTGKLYTYIQGGDEALESAKERIGKYHGLDAYDATILKDQFTKDATNGQAVRGFMQKMIDNHTPYADQARQAMGMFDQNLGDLDEGRANMLVHILDLYNDGIKRSYAEQIELAARRVDAEYGEERHAGDIVRQTTAPDLDLSKYIKAPGSSPAPADHGGNYPTPPKAVVDHLRSDPSSAAIFDTHYGPGAAERLLREGGSTGFHSSDDFHPVSDVRPIIERLYPGAHITSWERSSGDQLTQANPNSWHARGGAAADVRPIQGISFEDYVQGFRNAGYHVIEARDEAKHPEPWTTGPNWHVVLGESNA